MFTCLQAETPCKISHTGSPDDDDCKSMKAEACLQDGGGSFAKLFCLRISVSNSLSASNQLPAHVPSLRRKVFRQAGDLCTFQQNACLCFMLVDILSRRLKTAPHTRSPGLAQMLGFGFGLQAT